MHVILWDISKEQVLTELKNNNNKIYKKQEGSGQFTSNLAAVRR